MTYSPVALSAMTQGVDRAPVSLWTNCTVVSSPDASRRTTQTRDSQRPIWTPAT